jgi:glucose/arabinose dehydrogenase
MLAVLTIMMRLAPVLTIAFLAACGAGDSAKSATSGTTQARTAPQAQASAKPRLVKLGTFTKPTYMTAPPGDRSRLFVVEQTGRIRVLVGGRLRAAPFIDLSSQVNSNGNEQGLLSMAFAPDYATSRRFYVYFTDKGSRERIVEFKRGVKNASRAVLGSERVVMVMNDPEENHNGGQLQFGRDGFLYVGTGDGGGADDQHGARGNGQDLGSPLGKLLRIDPRHGRTYVVPSSNPFVKRAGARREIWSYGLRNPWRFSFDRMTGDLVIGDVGQDNVEEVDFAPRSRGLGRGANYGWRPIEGNRRNFNEPAPGAVAPVFTMTHAQGNCSITGGYVVRDKALGSLYGRYLFADLCAGEIRSLKLSPGNATGGAGIGVHVDQPSTFGQDARGRIYVASIAGPVYRLAAG